MFDVRCSMFDVRCSMFDVQCSMFPFSCLQPLAFSLSARLPLPKMLSTFRYHSEFRPFRSYLGAMKTFLVTLLAMGIAFTANRSVAAGPNLVRNGSFEVNGFDQWTL